MALDHYRGGGDFCGDRDYCVSEIIK
jgi:hypothetical protein